ncbi:tyrosine-type recombinase/integrase [Capnocytophaga genosp. AHN8471]|jgi:integrase|uniref:Tyrosine-type recombinase/integrase n=1 Tax=Capnocytophaga genosp. AHN8471 TaxID=327574 RepID=A0ABS1YX42_9FLAO|nr:site-specific integrase [Capnocytophaga genosp. AHN8471]MBM0650979.1 tyrosine-type recombinase/integrase [Capnocytophaga genosp. AHN8471]MBM0661639.1 tyrosine-type recombinase/integrase [Capnocytophaga genosp. AHN8471]
MNLKYHSQFLLDKEKDKPDARTRYRIRWGNNIVAFNLGYRIEVDKWSNETQRCKANTTHGKKKVPASVINRKLQLFEQAYEDTIKYFELQKVVPTKEQFQSVFNSNIGREKKVVLDKTFFEYYDDFMAEEGSFNQWTEATKIKLKVIRNHLFNFDSELTFEKLTEQKFIEYLNYLQRELKLKNSTILKHISFVKWFLRWSCRKGYNTNTFFEVFKPKLKDTQKKVIFLTPTEFKQFREYQIPEQKKYLERVRDVFLFQCFTGLRYSDVENLKKSDIRDNFIEVTTVKTSDSLKIELNQHSKGILDKYKDYEDSKGRALPVITNQRMNEYLKELAELAGINEPIRETYYIGNERFDEVTPKYALIGTHAGRRTFICNALSLGIPPQVVMKWTGHSDYKAMKPYIDIADETKANAMSKFNLL